MPRWHRRAPRRLLGSSNARNPKANGICLQGSLGKARTKPSGTTRKIGRAFWDNSNIPVSPMGIGKLFGANSGFGENIARREQNPHPPNRAKIRRSGRNHQPAKNRFLRCSDAINDTRRKISQKEIKNQHHYQPRRRKAPAVFLFFLANYE